MTTFRKKPVTVQAFQMPEGMSESFPFPDWFQKAREEGMAWRFNGGGFGIRTKEGVMRAEPQDWVIQGVKGEIYPCKPDIFQMTYDIVGE